jgi:hypothetical protein
MINEMITLILFGHPIDTDESQTHWLKVLFAS